MIDVSLKKSYLLRRYKKACFPKHRDLYILTSSQGLNESSFPSFLNVMLPGLDSSICLKHKDRGLCQL